MEEIKELIAKLDSKIDKLDSKIDKVSEELIDLKVSTARLEEKLNGIDKRLSNEEFISRSAFVAITGGVIVGVVKYVFFSDGV